MVFDFNFDSPVYQKTVWKADSKKKLRTCLTNVGQPSRNRGTCMKSVKWAADSGIYSWHLLHWSALDAEFNSASKGTSCVGITLEKYWGLGQNTVFLGPVLLVCPGKSCSSICDGFLVGFVGCKIKFYVQYSQLEG